MGSTAAGRSQAALSAPPRPDLPQDRLKRSIHIFQDQPRGQAQRPDAPLKQPGVSGRVTFRAAFLVVHRTVDLDRQAGGVTVEVEDIVADGVLATEVEAFEAMRPKRLPQEALWQRHFMPKASGSRSR